MSNFKHWQSKMAAIMALAMTTATVAPIVLSTPVSAQNRRPVQSQRLDYVVASRTIIPVTYDAEKIVVTPTETSELTLTVAEDVLSRDRRTVAIPQGSEISGELRPARNGSQFVAEELILPNGTRQSINANSRIVTKTEEVRRGTNLTSILTGAAVGSAAAAAISGITGDRRIGALEVLAGTGVGAVGGLVLGRNSTKVVVINPDTDLDLTLRSDLIVTRARYDSDYDYGYDTRNDSRPDLDDDRGI